MEFPIVELLDHETSITWLLSHFHPKGLQCPRMRARCRRSEKLSSEWKAYNHIIREHATVAHGKKEWARDDDGDGIREVHINTAEGMWTDLRNFLRPFKGVHKKYLNGYVAMGEFRRNLKRISPAFIAAIVVLH